MSVKKLIALLIGITLFAYLSSFTNPFIWDDEQFIQKNMYVQNFDIGKIFLSNTVGGAGVQSNYYRPLTSLSFAVDTKIWGSNAFGFHLTNIALHIGAGILLFFLLQSLNFGKIFSFCISLVFLIHPIQTEAVTYINSRGDSQYAFFLFFSLLLFVKGLQGYKTPWTYLGSIFSFLISLLSKETAMAGFPLYFCVLGFFYLGKRSIKKGAFLTAFSITASSFGYFLLRITVLNFHNTLNFYTSADIYSQNLAIRLFTFSKVIWIYMSLLLFPYPLHMERTTSLIQTLFSPWVFASILFMIFLLLISILEIRKERKPMVFFGFVLFTSLLIPVSGIIPINGILYEHWLYVPMIGFFILLLRSLQLVSAYIVISNWRSIIPIALLSLLSCIYVILTIRQNNIWSDPIYFYRYTLSFAPNSLPIHNNLGMSLVDVGRTAEAIEEYQKALRLSSEYPQIYNNLGNAYLSIGQYDKAEQSLKKALELAPHFEIAKVNLIRVYLATKALKKALELADGDMQLLKLIDVVQREN